MTRRKKILIGSLLALFLCETGIAGYLGVNWSQWTPVRSGSRYRLEDIGEDQTVLAVSASICRQIAVDKHGKWKHIDVGEQYDWYKKHEDVNGTMLEFYDDLLKDETIPYQLGCRTVSKPLLSRAINMEPFELEETVLYDGHGFRIQDVRNFYVVTGSGENRELTMIGSDGDIVRTSGDIRIERICARLRHYEEMS